MNVRIYAVQVADKKLLVRAGTKSAAVRHVARGLITAEVATQNELVALTQAGVKVVDASDGE